MKKTTILLMASCAAMLAFSSCEKSFVKEEKGENKEMKINIKVADLGGSPETRAAKTGWVAGDKLNLWFDDWNNTERIENHTPDLVLTYDGSALRLRPCRRTQPQGERSILCSI